MGFRDYRTGIGGTCLNCEDRHPACHDTCEKYQTARKAWDERQMMIREAKNQRRIYDDHVLHQVVKERKRGVNAGKHYKYSNKSS